MSKRIFFSFLYSQPCIYNIRESPVLQHFHWISFVNFYKVKPGIGEKNKSGGKTRSKRKY